MALLAEVSESALGQDRSKTLSADAKAGIVVSWIVNRVNRQVEAYSGPVASRDPSPTISGSNQQIPVAVGGYPLQPIAADDILS